MGRGAAMGLHVIEGGRGTAAPGPVPRGQEGFIQVYSSLVTTSALSNGAFRLYCLLTNYCWAGKNECNPSIPTLAETLGVGVATVRRWLAELESFSLVTVRLDRNGGSNHYRLNRIVRQGQGQEQGRGDGGKLTCGNVDEQRSGGIKINTPDRSSSINTGRSPLSELIPESHVLNIPTETYTQAAGVVGVVGVVDKWDKPIEELPDVVPVEKVCAVRQELEPQPARVEDHFAEDNEMVADLVMSVKPKKDHNQGEKIQGRNYEGEGGDVVGGGGVGDAGDVRGSRREPPDLRLAEFEKLLVTARVLPKFAPGLAAILLAASRSSDWLRALIVDSLDKHSPGAWLAWAIHNGVEPSRAGSGARADTVCSCGGEKLPGHSMCYPCQMKRFRPSQERLDQTWAERGEIEQEDGVG